LAEGREEYCRQEDRWVEMVGDHRESHLGVVPCLEGWAHWEGKAEHQEASLEGIQEETVDGGHRNQGEA